MRVLVCDDDADVGVFLQTLFDMEGWTTELVKSGEECLAHFESAPAPDVLVLDQVMPGLTGIATADRLRDHGFTSPIILCSGHLGPELNDDVARLGLIPINKIDLQALVRVVQAAVHSAVRAVRAQSQAPAKAARKKPAAKKATAKKPAVKKIVAKKPAAKKAAAKKSSATSRRKTLD